MELLSFFVGGYLPEGRDVYLVMFWLAFSLLLTFWFVTDLTALRIVGVVSTEDDYF